MKTDLRSTAANPLLGLWDSMFLFPERFTIVSYNILAVDNARAHWRELYYHIPSHVMQWNTRKRKLLQELGLWSPDIICLQVSCSSRKSRGFVFSEGLFPRCSYHAGILASFICAVGLDWQCQLSSRSGGVSSWDLVPYWMLRLLRITALQPTERLFECLAYACIMMKWLRNFWVTIWSLFLCLFQ